MKKITTFLLSFLLGSVVFSANPNWTVNPVNYQFSMNVTGVIVDACNFSGEIGDSISAFEGLTVRGVGEISQTVNGKHLVFLTVYSNLSNGETLTFKHYSVSQDTVKDIAATVVFSESEVKGNTSSPFQLYYNEPILYPTVHLTDSTEITVHGTHNVFSTIEVFIDNQSIGTFTDTIIAIPNHGNCYVVVNTTGGCTATSPTVNLAVASVKELSLESNAIKLFPVPAQDVLNIVGLNNFSFQTIQITDVTGKLYPTNFITKNTLNVSSLRQGVYIISIIKNNELVARKKFVKN